MYLVQFDYTDIDELANYVPDPRLYNCLLCQSAHLPLDRSLHPTQFLAVMLFNTNVVTNIVLDYHFYNIESH